MRTITLIVIHCSAVRPDQLSSAAQIDSWHRQRGFHLDIRGQPADTRTPEQKAALLRLLEDLHRRYPRALILGHHDLRSPVPPARSKPPIKDCPCFDAAREYADIEPR